MSSEVNSSTAIPLPGNRDASLRSQPPVWTLDPSDQSLPLSEMCDKNKREGGVCCKELKDEDDRTLINPDIVRDAVIGLSDGLTVPFALAAGLSSLGESRLVILGGISELIAGAISMGIGGFLASQAERDHYRFLKNRISWRVLHSCEGEMEREVHAILGPVGVDERTARAVAKCLRDVGCVTQIDGNPPPLDEEARSISWKSEVGLTPFFLRFGKGLEEVPTNRLYWSAITIGLGYLVGGIIPLIPYFFVSRGRTALMYSCILTGSVLLAFGAVKARVTGAGVRAMGYLWGAVSTLMVGGTAAAAAYGIVALLTALEV